MFELRFSHSPLAEQDRLFFIPISHINAYHSPIALAIDYALAEQHRYTSLFYIHIHYVVFCNIFKSIVGDIPDNT